jgi:hypothetical protein
MKKLSRVVVALATLSIGLLVPLAGQAEYCWMVGCAGVVGYVYLPAPFNTPKENYHTTLSGQDCSVAPTINPFSTPGLPDVNSVVAISNVGTLLLSRWYIETHLGDFPRVVVTQTDGGCQAVLQSSDLQGNPMRGGAQVKILGYQTLARKTSPTDEFLFALVLVVTD